MLFFSLSNTNIYFDKKKLTWRTYTIAETMSTFKKVELIDKYNFIKVALDENSEIFVIHVAALKVVKLAEIAIHLLNLVKS